MCVCVCLQVLEEADRSLHDALCVIRCLVQKRFLIAGGAAPEMELNLQLSEWAKSLTVRVCAWVLTLCAHCCAVRFCAQPQTLRARTSRAVCVAHGARVLTSLLFACAASSCAGYGELLCKSLRRGA